jgi:hypothetical protein
MTDTNALPTPQGHCQNCGAPLLGPHCYACGQPQKGLVRHFGNILGDFFDTVLNVDSRIFHTLWPLLAKPAFLSHEYFAGRRVRFVSPVRLFVFLSIITFFVAQLVVNIGKDAIHIDDNDRIARATTVAEVEHLRDATLRELELARSKIPQDVPGARTGVDAGVAKVRHRAEQRIAQLQRATAEGRPPPQPEDDTSLEFGDSGKPWDATTNPVHIRWWPQFANDWLNHEIGRAQRNIKRVRDDPNLLKDAVLGALPSTLFLLLPIFALMLKVLYLFKRRLYMEHLIVALHSHAFLCLTLLLVFVTMALRQWVVPPDGALHSLLGLAEGLLFAWMPVYLLLMQKRVYRQGWIITVLKYCTLGLCYCLLLSFGVAFTVLASLVRA